MAMELTDSAGIRKHVLGKVVRMANKDGVVDTYLDEVDVDDIIYDVTRAGGVKVVLSDDELISIVYPAATCLMQEIKVSYGKREFLELRTSLERYEKTHAPRIEDMTYDEAADTYRVELALYDDETEACMDRVIYSFDGSGHVIDVQATAIVTDFDDLKRHSVAYMLMHPL